MKKKIIVTITVIMVMMISLMNTSVVEAKTKAPKMSKKSITIEVGASKTVKLNNAKAKKVKWSTSNKKIAKVSKGKITAQKTGKCKITATYKNKKYICKVTVKTTSNTTNTTNSTTTTEKKKKDKTKTSLVNPNTTKTPTTTNTTNNTTVTPSPTTDTTNTTVTPSPTTNTTETPVETHTHSVDYSKTVWEYPEDKCHQPTIAHRYCSCGEWMYDDDMGIRGHKKYDYKEVVVEPTCTTDGYTECYCSDCGEFIYTCMETPAKGHTRKTTIDTESTCTTHGHHTEICSVCGETLRDYDKDLDPDKHNGQAKEYIYENGKNLSIFIVCTGCNKICRKYGYGSDPDIPNPYWNLEYVDSNFYNDPHVTLDK